MTVSVLYLLVSALLLLLFLVAWSQLFWRAGRRWPALRRFEPYLFLPGLLLGYTGILWLVVHVRVWEVL